MDATNGEKTDIEVSNSTNESKKEDVNLSSPEEVEAKLWEISELARRKKRLSAKHNGRDYCKSLCPKTINVKRIGNLIRENS